MPRTKFRSLRQSVTHEKRSRKPKEESNASDDAPAEKKLCLDVKGSPSTSKASPSSESRADIVSRMSVFYKELSRPVLFARSV